MFRFSRLWTKLKWRIWPRLVARLPWGAQVSYSQFGEDMVVGWLARSRCNPGFYVDIGAYHPVWLSNTFTLYCKGWRGICIEARPGAKGDFDLYRPRDINLELALTPQRQSTVELFLFEDPGLNTIDEAQATEYQRQGHKFRQKHVSPAATLPQVLDRHVPEGMTIDLLSIDIEGADEAILKTNDWTRYRPTILIVERAGVTFRGLAQDSLVNYLEGVGYELVAKCSVSLVFIQPARWREQFFAASARPPL